MSKPQVALRDSRVEKDDWISAVVSKKKCMIGAIVVKRMAVDVDVVGGLVYFSSVSLVVHDETRVGLGRDFFCSEFCGREITAFECL
ncbi:unnamed protein product [Enterobius vermicularis]|uniref:PH domain-containing protein n=1 Tax=Enterobius vermicularis TaxID=51028 RepID=A0A0N4VGN5_ENTVE|nr:unnamed protein product [Enterobius vermicularis]